MLTLSNIYGLWALVGIPVVLAIHFLQRRSVVLPISTLFLLERTQRESASGRRFDRLMNSIPLWMQLLAVLLLTWLLCEPRYQKARSTQRIAIVLDASASMQVFKERAIEALKEKLPELQGPAAALELTVFETTPGKPRLYTGESVEELAKALSEWQPHEGVTDPSQALRLARSLVSREGIVIHVTDTPSASLPFGARELAVGEAIDNVGFTGVSFAWEEGSLIWRALVRNYGASPASRTWTVETATGRSEPLSLQLDGGGLSSIQAAFPPGTDRIRVVLSEDRFKTDDVLPLVRPQPKPLNLFASTSPSFTDLTSKLLRSIQSMESVNDSALADLSLVNYDPLDPVLPAGNAVVFVNDETQGGEYLKGGIIQEPHPLIDGLNWQTLLVRETISLERSATDKVILWQGQRALIFIRETAGIDGRPATRQLCFNFDLRLSNAAKQPAFIVLLHRFAESIRENKVARESLNLETNEPVMLATLPGTKEQPAKPVVARVSDIDGKLVSSRELQSGDPLHAPLEPGFFSVEQDGEPLLEAAVHFGDTREADFSQCSAGDTLDARDSSAVERHTDEDPWWRWWVLALVSLLLISWRYTVSKRSSSPETATSLPTPSR